MRYIVVGSSHYTESVLRNIRKTDPAGIVYFVERSSEVAETIAKRFDAMPVYGNLTDISTYRKAEIDKADVFIAITDSDALNLKLTRMAREIYKIPKCILYLNNSLNIESVPRDQGISAITLQRYFDFELELLLSSDSWIEAPIPGGLGLRTYVYRFGKFSYGDLTLRKVREAVGDIDVTLLFFNSTGKSIENEFKVLSGGDYLVLSGEKERVEKARRKIDDLIKTKMVSALGTMSTSPPGMVR